MLRILFPPLCPRPRAHAALGLKGEDAGFGDGPHKPLGPAPGR